jgi:hypothetical protein
LGTEAKLEGEGLRDLLFRREIHPDEHHTKTFPGTLVLDKRRREIILSDEAGLNQAFTDLLAQTDPSPQNYLHL